MHNKFTPSELLEFQCDFPPNALELVRLIGQENAMTLILRMGGSVMRLYKSGRENEKICSLVGLAATEKLVRQYEITPFFIPRCDKAIIKLRNRKIAADYDRLTSVDKMSGRDAINHIVNEYGLGERSIYRILKQSN